MPTRYAPARSATSTAWRRLLDIRPTQTAGDWQALGTPGYASTEAYDVNDSTEIVGTLWDTRTDVSYAFWSDEHGVMVDLNEYVFNGWERWDLKQARAINNRGQIVGWGECDGEIHAVLLTPIPEPWVLGLLGLAFLGAMRRFRRR